MTIHRKRIYAAGLVAVALFSAAAYNHVIAQQGPDPKARAPVNDYNPGMVAAVFVDSTGRTHALVQQYSAVEDEVERAKIVKELTDVSSEEFDQKQANRGKQLDEMEAQLKRLRAIHDRRAKEKDEIVRDHVRHLLRGADGLGWGVEGDENPSPFGPGGRAMPTPGGGWSVKGMPGMPPGGLPPGNPFNARPGIGVKPPASTPSADGDRNLFNPGATPSRR